MKNTNALTQVPHFYTFLRIVTGNIPGEDHVLEPSALGYLEIQRKYICAHLKEEHQPGTVI